MEIRKKKWTAEKKKKKKINFIEKKTCGLTMSTYFDETLFL